MALQGKRICILVDQIYEDMELQYPRFRLLEEKIEVVLAGPEAGKEYKGKHGYPCRSDIAFTQLYENEFDGVVIPGGFAPDRLRRDPHVLSFVKQIYEAGKLVAHICHGGWVPISAKILKGVKCTSTSAIRDDMINAGCQWQDAKVVVDQNMISSRKPDDLPDFCREILKFLEQ